MIKIIIQYFNKIKEKRYNKRLEELSKHIELTERLPEHVVVELFEKGHILEEEFNLYMDGKKEFYY